MNFYQIIAFLFIISLSSLSFAERALSIENQSDNKRIALVIGNGNYRSSPLKNPINDASAMGDILKKNGFDVIIKLDANQRQMEQAINQFGKKLNAGGVGFFYYAGHGIQIDGRNYLIPIDVSIESESDVKYESIDAGRVLGKMHDAENSLNIIVMDACRNNPFSRSFRSSEKGLAKMDAPTGSILAYATSPGSVAADGGSNESNGLYTKYLLKYLSQPHLKIEDVFKKVRIAVVEDSDKKQVPWESSSLIGNFIFNINNVNIINTAPKLIQNSVSIMDGEWEAWHEKQAVSQISKQPDTSILWHYSIPEIIDDIDAGLFFSFSKKSIENKKIHLKLTSKSIFPVYLSVFSFVPGYSKEDDFESLVRLEIRLNLKPGENEFFIEGKDFYIPDWWLEERGNPSVKFFQGDIRGLEFYIDLETGFGPPSDTLIFHTLEIIN